MHQFGRLVECVITDKNEFQCSEFSSISKGRPSYLDVLFSSFFLLLP